MAENEGFDKVTEQAKRLGELIRTHPRYVKLRETDAAVRADNAATDALEAYNKAAAEIARKEAATQPVEVAEKQELQRLHNAVAASETIKAFTLAQADYAELMRRMNDTIFRAIAEDRDEATS
jgi:cell fate (sporulation/competence/biofilm development) regulator YlbF (YheA/YmcA/DUF963 family)